MKSCRAHGCDGQTEFYTKIFGSSVSSYRQCSVLDYILKRQFRRNRSFVLLGSFNINLTLRQVHGPRDFGDIVRTAVEED